MSERLFHPDYEVIGRAPSTVPIGDLADVHSVYAASPRFAVEHCGPLVSEILDRVPASWYDECRARGLVPNVDVRVHRLYPGVYPAFPGWHCDAEFREHYFAQPDLDRTPVSRTVVCTVSTHRDGVSNTEFLAQDVTLDLDPGADHVVWRQAHRQVEALHPRPATWVLPDGYLLSFSNATLHRARPATVRGWRLFFRMSMWHRPYLGESGKVSRQEQVYQVLEEQGW